MSLEDDVRDSCSYCNEKVEWSTEVIDGLNYFIGNCENNHKNKLRTNIVVSSNFVPFSKGLRSRLRIVPEGEDNHW